jgi:multidrug efflux pump subunit AcrB
MRKDRARLGLAGRLAGAFINSKLTPLLLIASVALGALAVTQLPREEEPQIVVPMTDIFVAMPGASAKEVEERVTKPLERLLWELPGVEYLYSTSSPGQSLVIVRFRVGENEEASLVRLNEKLAANRELIPQGASPPLVKLRSIDDVPVVAFTLWSRRYDGHVLRRVAAEVREQVKSVEGVSEVTLTGGLPRQVRVLLDPERLRARGLSPLAVAQGLRAANRRLAAGAIARDNREVLLETGSWLREAREVERVVVGASGGRPVFLGDVATIADGAAEATSYVLFGNGGAPADWPAVTLSVAKHKGRNAVEIVSAVRAKVESLRGTLLPAEIEMTVSRDYGETASEKSNELLLHMAIAIFSVSILIWVTLGRREAGIVLLAIPATLALTLAVFYFYGYTLNRIILFALIFSIGILVDDAIVVVENIARHFRMAENKGKTKAEVAVRAVDEVGNPTILATMTVIAAILPMAFVRGLMGPYMRPIPVGASAAMLFSLLVAFVITPWATIRLLKHEPGEAAHAKREGWSIRLYRRAMGPLLHRGWARWLFLGGIAAVLLGAMSLVVIRYVQVKMLPFDNKSELQLVVDLPEGTTLETTARVTGELARIVRARSDVVSTQSYIGTSGPYNFNGLVRHYFLRQGSNGAELHVRLLPKGERGKQSHEVAKEIRAAIAEVALRHGARVKVAEVPPGPPVLQTLVAEVYGPDHRRQVEIAAQVKEEMRRVRGIVDIDWYVEDEQPKLRFLVDREKAAESGVSEEALHATLRLATAGMTEGLLHDPREKEDVPVVLRLDRPVRSDVARLRSLAVAGQSGQLVSLGDLVRVEETREDRSIYHKNLKPVVYVTADVAGEIESPVYAMLELGPALSRLRLPEGYAMEQYTASAPFFTDRYAVKWDGEWHITFEVFRDLGLAFAAVLVLIYLLNVAWFQSFATPLVIMSAIPFSLVGILPAHGLMGAFFTATSMIGFIAGAGIVVRNSIILVDFVEMRLREGVPLDQAVVEAGAVRFRPMLLTAAAVIVGAGVLLFDPIFQGLAISLMAGEIASLLLSRTSVPVVYYLLRRRRPLAAREAIPSGAPG